MPEKGTPMSESEKIALLAKFEALPADTLRQQWLREHGVSNTPRFYTWRKQYLAAQKKERNKRAPGRAKGRPALTSGSLFGSLSREQKLQALREYDHLTFSEKASWRKRHFAPEGEDHGLLTYYRNAFRKEGIYSANGHKEASSVALVPIAPKQDDAALLSEYESLGKGGKSQFLKQHGLTHQKMHTIRSRVARNAQPLVPAVMPGAFAMPPGLVTLQDAIDAMQVRIDHYNDFMGHLRSLMVRGK